jgi:ABC-type dipeptide/oligopeptide/nickel transport system ATPase component
VSEEQLLEVRNLTIGLRDRLSNPLVHNVSLSMTRGEFLGIVGASGSGKTLTSLAISRLLPASLEARADRIEFAGRDLANDADADLNSVLGGQLAMVFQDPLSSLNPVRRIGSQMEEGVRRHKGLSRSAARQLSLTCLSNVGIDSPEMRIRQYPFELSGGMRQRVMIAMCLMIQPSLIIADEATTALDVTIQAQVLELFSQLNAEHGTAVLFISHNISMLSEICDRIVVMYRGRIVERLTSDKLVSGPEHPYTQALMRAVPDLTTDRQHDLATISDDTAFLSEEVADDA